MTIVLRSSSIVPLTELVQTKVVHHQAGGFPRLDVDGRLGLSCGTQPVPGLSVVVVPLCGL